MALLEVDRVAAGYIEGIDILAGISLRVEAGSVTGIIGPNGAGKSTLLKTIFGFLHPREGRIVHDGREIQRAAPHELKLLLVDEPSAGLAPRISTEVYARLVEARARGVTILLVDQNITKAVEVSDYLYVIEGGQVRRQGPQADFADHLRELIRDSLLGA